jgi:tRNA (guanine37-N1)-methyltransferase
MLLVSILSLFPEYFTSPFQQSIIKKAIERKKLEISLTDIRDFSEDKNKRVDDRPFGGGPGMVLCPKPVVDAIDSVKKEDSHVVYFSPQGSLLTPNKAKELSKKKHLVLLCGHYEGIDQRAIDIRVDEEISIGDYVLTNGCLPAIVLVDAVSRFLPEVLGNPETSKSDSLENGLFKGPVYTRPEEYKELRVPEVLLQGHHAKIEDWRFTKGLEKTKKVRPDLYEQYLKKKGEVL